MKHAAHDLERRRPVWEALSAVFLDTEVDEAWLAQVVETLVGSGYSEEELEEIFWGELCPVLHGNLLSMAGEWAGFDMDAVEQEILARPAGRLRRWMAWVQGGRLARPGWVRVREAVAVRRGAIVRERRAMRLRWQYFRFGPARVLEVREEAGVAVVDGWGDGETLAENVGEVALADLPVGLRHVGAKLWHVDHPQGGFDVFFPRAEGETLEGFERRWRRAHCLWWQVWRWRVWGWRIPGLGP
jgi:hypothetical protein